MPKPKTIDLPAEMRTAYINSQLRLAEAAWIYNHASPTADVRQLGADLKAAVELTAALQASREVLECCRAD